MRRRRPQPPVPGTSGSGVSEHLPEPEVRRDVLATVTARTPVVPPARDAASAVLHARLNDDDLRALRDHRAGDYGRLRAAATTDAERRRIDLIWAAHIPVEGALARTGLVADMPPAEIHAMASGPLAAGGDHYLADATLDALQTAGLSLRPGTTVLDFGCSSGRVTRVLGAVRPDVRWIGCDPNAQAIAWAREHLPMAEFFVGPARPPLDIDAGALDAAFAISVWSHFAEAVAIDWLSEMHRVVRPGGLLLITTHGLTSIARNAPTGALGEQVARAATESMLRGDHHFVDVWGPRAIGGSSIPQWGDSWCTTDWLAARVTPQLGGPPVSPRRTGREPGPLRAGARAGPDAATHRPVADACAATAALRMHSLPPAPGAGRPAGAPGRAVRR